MITTGATSNRMRGRSILITGAVLLSLWGATVRANSTVELPAASCGTDVLMASGFETLPAPGAPMSTTSTVAVPGFGNHTYYLRLPAGFNATERPYSVVLALHGSGGAGTSPANAAATRTAWASVADANQIIVAAPASNGSLGGWGASADLPMLAAIIDQLRAQYRLDPARLYLWGFSAGAHYGHGIVLDNTGVFAAYGISAGALYAYACDPSGAFACTTYLPAVPRKIPLDIHIGMSDPLFPNTSGDPARFIAGGWNPTQVYYTPFAGGHTYTTTQLGEIWANICRYALGP
jgi:hypothetical protein